MIDKKIIFGLDFFIIAATVICIAFMVRYTQPLVIFPLDEEVTNADSVLFSFEKGKVLVIDDNPDFTSPLRFYAQKEIALSLEPGKYYWKIEGIGSSEIRELTVISKLDLRVRDMGDKYEIVNAGNVELQLDVYQSGKLIDKKIIAKNSKINSSGNEFFGRQNG